MFLKKIAITVLSDFVLYNRDKEINKKEIKSTPNSKIVNVSVLTDNSLGISPFSLPKT